MPAQVRLEAKRIEDAKPHTAYLVLGTNIETEQLSDAEVIAGCKAPSQAEGGFRFLKDPWFFVSSWFVKKPRRIQGLLMVMTLALLVYAEVSLLPGPAMRTSSTRRGADTHAW